MKKQAWFLWCIVLILALLPLIHAATIQGTIYNTKLEVEKEVLLEVNTTPTQKYLARNGTYTFNLPKGSYVLTARKGAVEISEKLTVGEDGTYLHDIFLLPSLDAEEELWENAQEDLVIDAQSSTSGYQIVSYTLAAIIFGFLLYRILKMRKKYGSLRQFRMKIREEKKKSIEQIKEDIAKEPGYLEEVVSIIKKHEGRISQKELRREMLHLSEAKISLIVAELEHKGKIEKIKKGRANILILK